MTTPTNPTISDGWIGYASAMNTDTGYGRQGIYIAQNLVRSGYKVAFHDLRKHHSALAPEIDHLDARTAAHITQATDLIPEWGILHHEIEPTDKMPNPKLILWSMWEADRIFPKWTGKINRHVQAMIVPSTEVRKIFQRSGVELPTEIVHDCIDTNFWTFKKRTGPQNRPFTFAMWGYMNTRKAPWQVVNAFVAAFGPNNPNVRLIMKTAGYEFGNGYRAGIPQIPFTNNVQIINEHWSEERLQEFVYNEIDCGLFGSFGEGFMDTPLEALATGLPVISPDHSGPHDYADDRYLYPIRLHHMESAPRRPGQRWWVPDWDHAIEHMREVYGKYDRALRKAKAGAKWVSQRWSVEHQRTDLQRALGAICNG